MKSTSSSRVNSQQILTGAASILIVRLMLATSSSLTILLQEIETKLKASESREHRKAENGVRQEGGVGRWSLSMASRNPEPSDAVGFGLAKTVEEDLITHYEVAAIQSQRCN